MSKLEYLEEERKKIWAKLVDIEADLKKKTSDFEQEARQSSKKASEFRNRCEKSNQTANEHLKSIIKSHAEIDNYLESFRKLNDDILNIKTQSSENLEASQKSFEEISSLESSIRQKIETLEKIFDNHQDLSSEIEGLESVFTEGEDLQSKINTLHKSSLSRKKEIDQLYYDIIGYTEKDENGEETYIEGLKDGLENSFSEIKANIKEFKEDLSTFKESKEKEVVDFIESWAHKIEGINKKITELLPNALTAGLSHAYSIKKDAEEVESVNHIRIFHKSIFGLIIVSLIPFIINIIMWLQGRSLHELIIDMPRIVLAIMPLYIPLLWVAYTASKRSNLSKRLIEEYTHKEVLSKTFEGLSRQIGEIDDQDISAELRVKLIYNILNVSSENPGKLIKDYSKADHPLFDALDKSVQLATAVDKLSGIPGFSKLSKILDNKSKQIVREKALKAEQGLCLLDTDEKKFKEEEAEAK